MAGPCVDLQKSSDHPVSLNWEESRQKKVVMFHSVNLDPSVDLRKETLDFTRADLNREDDVVHSYSDEKDRTYRQMDQYRGRTTLNKEDLIRGIISLNLSLIDPDGQWTVHVML
ncbi:butyrophilin subfamily 2 member A2-like isoform X1 [Lates japonicus]|uniref:Butyrophilin subfamily 2 member A2-like isoform X1 n=1 Tax=Lates japonicus TaxID=270547 RepID=A0AAD3MWC6_LATJO|nr:butyrophilin subfamily 2 member A2-like isoform X1 [Lates japonicus]